MPKTAIGIDLGGTKIAGAIVDREGRIIFRCKTPTEAADGKGRVLTNLEYIIGECLDAAQRDRIEIAGIGIGAPGQLDTKRGIVISSPNLSGWLDVPLIDHLRSKFSFDFKLDNDVRAAARGEMLYGAARELRNFACVTLGTGIGACLVINKEIYAGSDECAGEIGHITLLPDGPLCGCGNRGCLEALAAAPAVVRLAQGILAENPYTILRERAYNGKLTAASIAAAAEAGDELAREIFSQIGQWLGIGLAALVNLFNPEALIIGGAMAKAEAFLFPSAMRELKARALKVNAARMRLLRAQLGVDAGVVGAASMVL